MRSIKKSALLGSAGLVAAALSLSACVAGPDQGPRPHQGAQVTFLGEYDPFCGELTWEQPEKGETTAGKLTKVEAGETTGQVISFTVQRNEKGQLVFTGLPDSDPQVTVSIVDGGKHLRTDGSVAGFESSTNWTAGTGRGFQEQLKECAS